MTEPRRSALMSWVAAMCIAALALLSGCADLRAVTSEVSSFSAWPSERSPGSYVFERLPSQQADASLQDLVEQAAEPALAQAGFKRVDTPAQADVWVQVGLQRQTVVSDWRDRWDPFWPYGRWGVTGFYGGQHRGLALGVSAQPPLTQVQVSVLIRDKITHQVLYETKAVRQNSGGFDARLMSPMFAAALQDFPLPAISPRTVTISMP